MNIPERSAAKRPWQYLERFGDVLGIRRAMRVGTRLVLAALVQKLRQRSCGMVLSRLSPHPLC
jgi:hypothetical protein